MALDIYNVSGVFALALLVSVVILYFRRLRKFEKEYSDFKERLDRHTDRLETAPSDGASLGDSYALASRGPSVSRDAEMQSAETRWRHLAVAFPHLGRGYLDGDHSRRSVILVKRKYSDIDAVERMQQFISEQVRFDFKEQGVLEPSWISEMGEDFDALRHPQLAIANPAIYTFPFFLTWQRRHQWGVLPYATHTRLGIIVGPEHPNLDEMREIETEYQSDLEKAASDGILLWANDPRYAAWLKHLCEAAGDNPVHIKRGDGNSPLSQQHTSPTLFSVGAYLHKELLPLTCAAMAEAKTAGAYAAHAREIEVSEIDDLGLAAGPSEKWPEESAVIADLAVIPPGLGKLGWEVLQLPHCVYVPIGIGFSISAVPLLDRKWRNRTLAMAGEMLAPASAKLADIGIEVDRRLWTAGRRDGG